MTGTSDAFKDIVPLLVRPPLPSPTIYNVCADGKFFQLFREYAADQIGHAPNYRLIIVIPHVTSVGIAMALDHKLVGYTDRAEPSVCIPESWLYSVMGLIYGLLWSALIDKIVRFK